jgi:hypothetical protein
LTGTLTEDGQLNLLWPPTANGFLLQSTTNLASPDSWTSLNNRQITTNGFSNGLTSVTISLNNGPTFYRLAQP